MKTPPLPGRPLLMRKWLKRLARLLLMGALVVGALLGWNLRAPDTPEPQDFSRVEHSQPFQPLRLRVVTWNVWGLLWMTPRRAERLEAVAREVARLKPDIVGFQEAFVQDDRTRLIAALRGTGLEHFRYVSSGLVGSGLLLASRFPVEAHGFVRFKSNGRPEMLHHGDWWAGKGFTLSRVTLPDGTSLYLGNTHFHARYRIEMYHPTQLAQAAQFMPWARRVRETQAPALWMGDWNSTPDSDVLSPLASAGGWTLLTTKRPKIDHIFGSGDVWEWKVADEGQTNGHLDGEPKAPWSDHAARWVDVELRRK